MKYCLSSRQTGEYLAKADEIWVDSRDHDSIISLTAKYPKATIILDSSTFDCGNDKLIEYNTLTKGNFVVCTRIINKEIDNFFVTNGIKYFWGYEVCTPYELKGIAEHYHVSYVRVGAPLFFQQDIIAKFGIPVRATANIAHFNYIPQTDGVNGTWIRPEDVGMYEPTVAVIEFSDADRSKEQALYRIYAEQHAWPGEVSMIITNIGKDCTNRMLPPDFTEARLNCGQKCAAFGRCRLCYHYFSLADPDKYTYLREDEGK